MRGTRGYAHADRRTLHTMIIMTRGSAEVKKANKQKKILLYRVAYVQGLSDLK